MVEDAELEFETGASLPGLPGFVAAQIFATRECPPTVDPVRHGDHHDVRVEPGLVRWTVFRFGPEFAYPMHHTDTVDFDIVLEGSVEIVLDDGAHLLGPGDSVVVTGVDHGWKAGPEGFVMSVAVHGAEPRA
jgi:quercetin dioxygenase-like cupin family protein